MSELRPSFPPFDGAALLAFLLPRCIPGVEKVENGCYWRTVSGDGAGAPGWLQAEPGGELRLSPALEDRRHDLKRRLRRLFDLDLDPYAMLKQLGELAAGQPGLRLPGAFDSFEMAVRALLGQQVSVAAAHTLAGRVASRFGEPLIGGPAGLVQLFPSAARLAAFPADELAAVGLPRARARALASLAQACAERPELLEPTDTPEQHIAELQALPGIGPWTAHYLAMRALRWSDAFPHADLGVRKALGSRNDRETLALAEAWRPWRAYATLHLWRRLSSVPAD